MLLLNKTDFTKTASMCKNKNGYEERLDLIYKDGCIKTN